MNKEKCIEIGAAIAKMNQINNKLEFFCAIKELKDNSNAILPDLLLESRIQNCISDINALNQHIKDILNGN